MWRDPDVSRDIITSLVSIMSVDQARHIWFDPSNVSQNYKILFSSNSMICIVYQNQIQPSFIQVLRFLFVYFLWKIKAGKMLQFSIITMIPSYKIKHRETLKYKLFRKNKSNSALCKQSIGNKKKTVPFLESSCFRGLTLNFLRWQKAFLICL